MTLTSMPSCPRAAAGEDPTPHPSVYFSDAMKKRSLGLRAPKSWDVHTWVTQCSFSSVQFSSVARSCPTLSDPMDCTTPGFPVHHQLPKLTQTHVH